MNISAMPSKNDGSALRCRNSPRTHARRRFPNATLPRLRNFDELAPNLRRYRSLSRCSPRRASSTFPPRIDGQHSKAVLLGLRPSTYKEPDHRTCDGSEKRNEHPDGPSGRTQRRCAPNLHQGHHESHEHHHYNAAPRDVVESWNKRIVHRRPPVRQASCPPS